MPSEVLYTPYSSSGGLDNLNRRVSMMLNRIGFLDSIKDGKTVAVKIHPGERNNITYLRPSLVGSVVEQLAKRGARPFVTETTTLYCRNRFNPAELLETAAFNGFTSENLSCPFVVADEKSDAQVPIEGRRLSSIGVAGAIAAADSLLVLTHVTLHAWTAGLGGAVKQLGMGCVGRKTKAEVHLSTTITIKEDLCNGCWKCVKACKSKGVTNSGEIARLSESCTRCGVCIASCPQGAIGYSHDYDWFARALAESASGVLSSFDPGNVAFVNYILDVTWHCDCEEFSDSPVFGDLGVVVSTDPVAVDQACADLINDSVLLPGSAAYNPDVKEAKDKIRAISGIEWHGQLEHAESLGLGSRRYRLKKQKS